MYKSNSSLFIRFENIIYLSNNAILNVYHVSILSKSTVFETLIDNFLTKDVQTKNWSEFENVTEKCK